MSTRRARIKAVTALPPRRRNVDAESKKKPEEKKEGFEPGIKDVASKPSSEDKSKDHGDTAAQGQVKDGFEAKASPSKRRLSVEKTPKEGFEEGIKKTPLCRRLSVQKTPRNRASVDKSPKVRRISIDKTPNHISTEIANKSKEKTPSESPKLSNSLENTASSSKSNENNVPRTNILKDLLHAPRIPPHFNIPYIENKPSTSKEDNQLDRISERRSNIPIFASPLARASPRRPSPIVRTPVIEVDLTAEKFIAPHKGPNSVITTYIEKHADVNKAFANPEVDVIVEKIIDKDVFKNLTEFATKSSETGVMDGIVPLQQVSKAPKPIDLLKNEMISENAEVLFDPIVPLPSPSKVRPKLRPMPRLGPRRNSFQQGSASESEDENRRLLGRPATPATPGPARQRHDSHSTSTTSMMPREVARVRNDSVCSTVSQGPSHTVVGSPLREREKSHKSRREEMAARRNAAMRRRQMEVERDKLTMYDLIFYNPKANPIIPDQDEIKAKEASKKEDEERKAEADKQESKQESDAAPTAVPQIKLGPNGEIILDEQSLVVNQSDQRKLDTSIVREGAWGGAGSRAYRRTPRTADWNDAETVRFYRALAALGTDFTLMQPLFPTRSRRDLKLKFKKEERMNLAQVDLALRSGSEWNPERLQIEFTEERKAAEEAALKAKERLLKAKEEEKERQKERKNLGVRKSRCSRPLGDSGMPKCLVKQPPSGLDEYVKFQEERTRQINREKRARKRNKQLPELTPIKRNTDPPIRTPSPSLATITLVDRKSKLRPIAPNKQTPGDMAIITKENPLPTVPQNIETGSLVVLTVSDPKSPSRKMLQTYLAQGPGNLTPVSLPANFLNSVVGFMKKTGSPKATVGSPTVSLGNSKTPNINLPRKRKSSYTITNL